MSEPSAVGVETDYAALLRPAFEGRRFIMIGSVVTQLAALARQLVALGAERPFLLAQAVGAGEVPDPDELPWQALDLGGGDLMEVMWRYEAALPDPPAAVRQALDAWDPDGRALAAGYIVLSDVPSVAGRARYGGRPAAWSALEDKTRVHELLDSLDVRRGPLAITPARESCLRAAHARLDRGAGTVWAGDCAPGIHGGGRFVRWVRDEASLRAACALFEKSCERVRVMPFVEGVPCSIHGLVFPDDVAVFRPVEMVTLRGASGFLYAGTGTFWDPPAAAREQLRELGHRVGAGLRERVGYRGVFTLDGVLGEDGFVPTELNPRIGAGFFHLADAVPELPLGPLALAVQAGEALDWRPRELEARVVAASDRSRSGSGRVFLPDAHGAQAGSHALRREGTGYRVAEEGEAPDGWLSLGETTGGHFLMFLPNRSSLAPGEPLAPRVAAAFAAADDLFGTGIGPLSSARVVA